MKRIEIPALGVPGPDTQDPGWHRSKPVPIPAFGGRERPIVVEEYEGDPRPDEFHAAVHNFLTIPPPVLKRAGPPIYSAQSDG